MSDNDSRLVPPPSGMREDDFVARFGALYEHSQWVAQRAWQHGLSAAEDCVGGLATALAAQVEDADAARQLALIRAHPDLGGKAALARTLTVHSAREQAGAGLDACSPEELARLQQLNDAYTTKFGFPFVVAVKGLGRQQILQAMAERLDNEPAAERRRALDEIHKIARLRLANLAQ